VATVEFGLNEINTGLQLKESEFDGISYVCPTWNQMGTLNFDLARQIVKSGRSFDRIVALARGGWTWARDLADALNIPRLSSTRVESYIDVNESGEPRITQPLTDSISGENILLFDEVVDSGATLRLGKKYLEVMGARGIKTVALCVKPRSEEKPDFYAFSTSAWVVFPHEIREFIGISIDKWRSNGVTAEGIKERFKTIGISPNQVEFYCSLHAQNER